MSHLISTKIQTFLTNYINSVDELEVLLLVQTHPERDWNATEISDRLSMDPISASNRLMALSLQGLLSHPSAVGKLYHYRFQPNLTLRKITAELAEAYLLARVEICDYVTQNQRGQMLAFAKAFELKKGE